MQHRCAAVVVGGKVLTYQIARGMIDVAQKRVRPQSRVYSCLVASIIPRQGAFCKQNSIQILTPDLGILRPDLGLFYVLGAIRIIAKVSR